MVESPPMILRPRPFPVKSRLSYSMLSAFLACRERAHLSYQRRIKKRVDISEARDVGTMFHDGLEFFYNSMRDDAEIPSSQEIDTFYSRLMRAKEEKLLASISGADTLPAIKKAVTISRPLLKGYAEKWGETDFKREWLINEGHFEIPAPGPWGKRGITIQGFWDGVFRNPRGELWIFETKTKSKSIQTDRLTLDMQLATYHYACEHALGEKANGALYNVVIRPGLRQKKGRGKNPIPETDAEYMARIAQDIEDRPEHYFQRHEVPATPQEIDRARDNLIIVIDEFMKWQMGESPTYLNSHSCENPFRCEYLDLCASGSMALYENKSS